MTWEVADLFQRLTSRDEPGPGIDLPPSGIPGDRKVKMKSIPNVDTERLQAVRDYLCQQIHTSDGLAEWDESRRQLVNAAARLTCINFELHLRGRWGLHKCDTCASAVARIINRKAEQVQP